MAHVPGFQYIVEQNGTAVPFSRVSFTRHAQFIAPGWNIVFNYPIVYDMGDTWTIRRGICGQTQTLINKAKANTVKSDDGVKGYTRTISGAGMGVGDTSAPGVDDLLHYGIPTTYVFVDAEWARYLGNTVYVDGQGVLRDNSGDRIYHPRLPSKEIKEGEFRVILGAFYHRDIARWLAQQVGYRFFSNVPQIKMQRSRTVQSGTTWFDAIVADFLFWEPFIHLENDDTIMVLDIFSDLSKVPGFSKMFLEPKALTSVSQEDDRLSAHNNIVEHVIIEGKESKNTVIRGPDNPSSQFSIDLILAESALMPNKYRKYRTEVGGAYFNPYRLKGAYTGEWGEGATAFTPAGLGYVLHEEWDYEIGPGNAKRVLDKVSSYDDTGKCIHITTKSFGYHFDYSLVRTTIIEEGLIKPPGKPMGHTEMMVVKAHHILQNRYNAGLHRALTSEMVEGLVVFELDPITQVRYTPVSLVDGLRSDPSRVLLDTDPNTWQQLDWIVMKQRWEKIERNSYFELVQVIYEFDLLSGSMTINPQILKNTTFSKYATLDSRDDKLRWEYFKINPPGGKLIRGVRCYHPPKIIRHEDITTEEIAIKIRNRQFAKYSKITRGLTVKTAVPIPILTTSFLVSIPAFSYNVNDRFVTVPGGDYILQEDEEQAAVDGGGKLNYERTFKLTQGFY